MVKIQDFARECGITDRQVQRQLKKYAAELDGLYERKGQGGTWLTEEACEILRSKMKQQPLAVIDKATERENERLQTRIRELEQLLSDKEKLLAVAQKQVSDLQLTAAKVYALEEGKKALEDGKKDLEARLADKEAKVEQLQATVNEFNSLSRLQRLFWKGSQK